MTEPIRFSDLLRNGWRACRNCLRLLGRGRMDYVVLKVSGSYPERTQVPERRFPLSLLPWPSPAPSVESFARVLEQVAADSRVKGVVLIIADLSAGPATVRSLRQAVTRCRDSGKRVVGYVQDLTMWTLYLASACDRIMVPESTHLRVAGLWVEALFLKNSLALVGLEADFESIAEYKVTPDVLRRAKMSEPHREMLESILDSVYAEVMTAISAGRGLTLQATREALDSVPLTAIQARDRQLLDGLCYEDELPIHLGTREAPAALVDWEQAQRRLRQPLLWSSRRSIGLISLEGMIVVGSSRQAPLPLPMPLPLPPAQAGSDTLVQQLRAAAQDRRLAAVVLQVDSPGGSALAADLIWRAADRLSCIKPLVVYMGNRAASGGYYVAAPAHAIVAQPTSLTGSIGIWGGKIVTRGLYEKSQAQRHVVSRGAGAGLYSDLFRFSDEERARIRADMGADYARFKDRVSQGRGLTAQEVESIARGRVWTGEQAMYRRLVDELGDIHAAVQKARQLAGLDPRRHVPLVRVSVPRRYQLPQPLIPDSRGWLTSWIRLLRGCTFALAPWTLRIGG